MWVWCKTTPGFLFERKVRKIYFLKNLYGKDLEQEIIFLPLHMFLYSQEIWQSWGFKIWTLPSKCDCPVSNITKCNNYKISYYKVTKIPYSDLRYRFKFNLTTHSQFLLSCQHWVAASKIIVTNIISWRLKRWPPSKYFSA